MSLKTQQEYLIDPMNCPFCGNPEINDSSPESCLESDGTFILDVPCECNTCKKSWLDRYKLFAYGEVLDG